MYLSDEEVEKFAQDCLRWIRPEGYLFFRESCFHPSGDADRDENPTQYRHPEWYDQTFSTATLAVETEDGPKQDYGLKAVRQGKVQSYVDMKQNQNQRWWLWKKVPLTEKTN